LEKAIEAGEVTTSQTENGITMYHFPHTKQGTRDSVGKRREGTTAHAITADGYKKFAAVCAAQEWDVHKLTKTKPLAIQERLPLQIGQCTGRRVSLVAIMRRAGART
jgi:hypothetical protein